MYTEQVFASVLLVSLHLKFLTILMVKSQEICHNLKTHRTTLNTVNHNLACVLAKTSYPTDSSSIVFNTFYGLSCVPFAFKTNTK